MAADTTIDAVDYAILVVIKRGDGSLWKKQIRDAIMEAPERFPQLSSISPQTVGRHVNTLEAEGLLTASIIRPPELNRSFIIGYSLTADGAKIIPEKRRELLRAQIIRSADQLLGDISLPAETATPRDDISHTALVELVCDEFLSAANDACRENLENVETAQLLALIAVHYFNQNISRLFNDADVDTLAALLDDLPPLRDSLTADTPITRLRAALQERQADTDTAASPAVG